MKTGAKRKAKGLLTALMLAVTCGATAQDLEPLKMPTVNEDAVMQHIVELSSERYAGRLAGTEGYNTAVDYVEKVLKGYGLTMMSQPFEIECNEVENCKFNTYLPGTKEKRVYTLGNEFCCAGMTGRGYVDAQMVFCGYGLSSGMIDDYEKVDVKGKIVVVLSGLPEGGWLSKEDADRSILLRDKARIAEKHGALGMLVVNTSNSCPSYEPQSRIYCGEMPHLSTFPILHLTLDCGRELLQDEAMALDSAMSRINWLHAPCSFALTKRTEIDVNARYTPRAKTCNLMALLPGSDKRMQEELVVVAASLDHAGMQGETCLFPGADINASGVAALLETARLLSSKGYRPRRSILFVLFSGSETQYMGSRIFVTGYKNMGRIEACINLQNIGSGEGVALLGGARHPELWDLAKKQDDFNLVDMQWKESTVRGDARAFDAMGVPSLVFTAHKGMRHNHVTSDIWENIDRRLLVMTTQMAVGTVREVSDGYYQGRKLKSRSRR